jgi:excisionase family DNA binding protein
MKTASQTNQDQMILSPIPLSAFESLIFDIVAKALENHAGPDQSSIEVNENLTIKEAAEYLGVTKVTIHRYKNDNVFPYYQTGRTVYFKKAEIDSALSNKKKGASK